MLGQSQPIGAATPDAVTGTHSQHQARHSRPRGAFAMRSFLAIVAGLLLCAPVVAQSGWYVRQSPDYDQCIVLIDSVPGGSGCVNRLSVMCTQNGQGYSRGYANYSGPVALPITLQLYQPPNVSPVGSLTITSLGLSASMSLNGSSGAWTQAAVFSGLSCATSIRKPNDRP